MYILHVIGYTLWEQQQQQQQQLLQHSCIKQDVSVQLSVFLSVPPIGRKPPSTLTSKLAAVLVVTKRCACELFSEVWMCKEHSYWQKKNPANFPLSLFSSSFLGQNEDSATLPFATRITLEPGIAYGLIQHARGSNLDCTSYQIHKTKQRKHKRFGTR